MVHSRWSMVYDMLKKKCTSIIQCILSTIDYRLSTMDYSPPPTNRHAKTFSKLFFTLFFTSSMFTV